MSFYGRAWTDDDEDYWFEQRYEDLLYEEHTKDHPNSDPDKCRWCEGKGKE